MKAFPSITKMITLEEALKITGEYLLAMREILGTRPHGPFDMNAGWEPTLFHFQETYFSTSLLSGLFGDSRVSPTHMRVNVDGVGGVSRIEIYLPDKRKATIEVRDGEEGETTHVVVAWMVGEENGQEHEEMLPKRVMLPKD